RNVHPQELEEAVGALDGVRRGCVAVFAVADATAGTERLGGMAERAASDLDASATDAPRQRIAELAIELTGTAPAGVTLVPPATVPKTSSGKIRREAARALWSSGLAERPRGVRRQLLRLGAAGVLPRLRRLRRRATETLWGVWAWLALALVGVPTYAA